MGKKGPRPRKSKTSAGKDLQTGVEGDRPQRHERASRGEQRKLPPEIFAAVVEFPGEGAVARGRASAGGRQERP